MQHRGPRYQHRTPARGCASALVARRSRPPARRGARASPQGPPGRPRHRAWGEQAHDRALRLLQCRRAHRPGDIRPSPHEGRGAGLSGGHYTTIRHTVLTWLDERHVETRRAAQLAGHKDERTTKKISTHSSPDVLKGAVDILDDAIEPLPKIEHKPLPEEPETTPKNGLCPNGTKEPTTMRLVPRLKKCGKSLINCHGAVERTRTSTPCGANPSS